MCRVDDPEIGKHSPAQSIPGKKGAQLHPRIILSSLIMRLAFVLSGCRMVIIMMKHISKSSYSFSAIVCLLESQNELRSYSEVKLRFQFEDVICWWSLVIALHT